MPNTALEQLLALITRCPPDHPDPQMLSFIDWSELREQLQPALQVLRFGGKVIGPAEAAVLGGDVELRALRQELKRRAKLIEELLSTLGDLPDNTNDQRSYYESRLSQERQRWVDD